MAARPATAHDESVLRCGEGKAACMTAEELRRKLRGFGESKLLVKVAAAISAR
jgi:hypothetical protein